MSVTVVGVFDRVDYAEKQQERLRNRALEQTISPYW